MKKSSDFLSKYYHWIILLFMCAAMLVIHQFVIIGGDDYFHASAVSGSLKDFWDFHVYHYRRGNGRAIIHVILTLFFIGKGVFVWRIINPLVAAATVILCSKAFTDNQKDFQISVASMSVMFLCLGGKFTSNSIYSLSPVFNYLYPFLLMLPIVILVNKTYSYNKSFMFCRFWAFLPARLWSRPE